MPLNGVRKDSSSSSHEELFQYYTNVVPISFTSLDGRRFLGNQFTSNFHKVDSRAALVIK